MPLVIHFAPRAVALVAWALAVTVAAGVATPRLRAPGRERTSRAGIARAGSQRPDDPRAWVAPGTNHDPEYTAASEVISALGGDHDSLAAPGGHPAVVPVLAVAAPPSSSVLARTPSATPRSARWQARRSSGRSPPLA